MLRALAASAAAALAVCAPATAAVQKLTFQVPVRTPDETGARVHLDTDVFVPGGPAPREGRPLIEVFHGGGSEKSNAFDAGHARFFAEHGYVAVIYSQRGNGASNGLEAVAGPNEMRDLFDVTQWALGHPEWHIDRRRIALTGYSQGGLNTNLGQVWAADRAINPYGIRFAALEPANTPDHIVDALVPGGVDKLSVGVGLLETYLVGARAHVSPLLAKWIGTEAADAVYAQGADRCDVSVHDTLESPTLNDFAARSVGCFARRMTPPVMWAQAFDDSIFPSSMATAMFRRLPHRSDDRLYLDMGGHAAPASRPEVLADKLAAQLAFFDHVLRGRPLRLPRVVFWTRDPTVRVPARSFAYPPRAWVRRTASTWPPRDVRDRSLELGVDGALGSQAPAGGIPLLGAPLDPGSDEVLQAALSATPLGASPVPPAPAGTTVPGAVAGFSTAPTAQATELSGTARLRVRWTPNAPDTQVVAKVYDRAPDGTLTLLARGVAGLRGALPGQPRTLSFATNDFSVIVHPGHRVVVTLAAGDASFYKPFATSGAGGTLTGGAASRVTLPYRGA